jgi:hypothetical protein
MQSSPLPLTDAEMPALFTLANALAIRTQRLFFRLLGAELLFLSLGTLAGIFGTHSPTIAPFAIASHTVPALPVAELVAAALIVVALGTRTIRALRHFEARWYESRAIAESAKSIAWRYAVGGHPFELGKNAESVVDGLVLQHLRETLTDMPHAWRVLTFNEQGQITDAMRTLRRQAATNRQKANRTWAIEVQARWYEDKQRQNRNRARIAQWALVFLEVLAVFFVLLQALNTGSPNLQAFVSTLATAGIAWTQAHRYQDLSSTYGAAAKEARALEQRMRTQPPEDEELWARFVDDAEKASSRGHRLWRATRDEK